jgi:hypothetical protein
MSELHDVTGERDTESLRRDFRLNNTEIIAKNLLANGFICSKVGHWWGVTIDSGNLERRECKLCHRKQERISSWGDCPPR